MKQDCESGARAVEYGLNTARQIASILGGTKVGYSRSNEYRIRNKVIAIKCAKLKNDSVGVSYQMLERLDAIWGAFEGEDGSYDLYEMTPDTFKNHMRPTRSTGPSAGRVGIVKRSWFLNAGTFLETVKLQ